MTHPIARTTEKGEGRRMLRPSDGLRGVGGFTTNDSGGDDDATNSDDGGGDGGGDDSSRSGDSNVPTQVLTQTHRAMR
jgi:hypothetical protein